MTESDNTPLINNNSGEVSVTIELVREEYEKADNFSRIVANYINEVSIPANNQLRYAGHHFLSAISDDGSIGNPDQLRRAFYHCQRAQYEAAESGIVGALDNIELFRRDYRRTVVTSIVPNYIEIKRIAKEAKQLLEQSREAKNNADLLVDLLDMFGRVSEAAETLDDSREEINKKVAADRRASIRWVIGISLSIVVVVLAALGLILAPGE